MTELEGDSVLKVEMPPFPPATGPPTTAPTSFGDAPALDTGAATGGGEGDGAEPSAWAGGTGTAPSLVSSPAGGGILGSPGVGPPLI